ncbi:MerR family transcriptional regulator [Alkalihalobacillus trypoxylicola]|uniref:Transcriptional regulator n=1 Tax=Alkalihalobacillus trypoxylicola TaxID=519424 RepID=A0A162F7I0_9BACI|nr:MerR family transcriptional regulator [Alkalihalobacillus trypoxylicola]KYG34970.1 transcriptional regulator [Alkalihalobacillus trypoxylicola]GAF63559.1 putative transcriptional regulator [Bacillus sp. TS-2]
MRIEDRRNTPLFPIGIVIQLTELTARQIRYYEEHQLVKPVRTKGNQRLFTFNDVDRLLEIKDLLEKGFNLSAIKHYLEEQEKTKETLKERTVKKELSQRELRKRLKSEIMQAGKNGKASLIQGELSRFYPQHKR